MSECEALAKRALRLYALASPEVRFVRHNENMTFEVVDGGGEARYLLRIHEPASANFVGPGQWRDYLESEMAWLEALAKDTDIVVQTPVTTGHGEVVTSVAFEGREVHCTMLRWIDGKTLDPKAEDAVERMRELGSLVAALHSHVERWTPPSGFVRLTYNAAHFLHARDQLLPSVGLGFLTADEFALMEQTLDQILALLDAAEGKPGQWGLIHADLGPGNVVSHLKGLSPIDFSLSGFGPLLWDVGGMLSAYPKPLHRPMFEAYRERRPVSEGAMRLMDGLAILSVIGCWAFHISNPKQHEWLARRMPKAIEGEWRPFLAGEPSLLDLR